MVGRIQHVLRDQTLQKPALLGKARENEILTALLETLSELIARVLPVSEGSLRFAPNRRGSTELLRGLELVAEFADSSSDLPISSHGRGTASTAALLAALLYATESQASLILALEEPEVALHPHVQRLLVTELLRRGVQLIMTTHSPVVVGACEPEQILLVRKNDGATIASRLITGQSAAAGPVEKDLNGILAEAVFSKSLLIVEVRRMPLFSARLIVGWLPNAALRAWTPSACLSSRRAAARRSIV
jgi:putative ATP-dependent endonuclease of OLD family